MLPLSALPLPLTGPATRNRMGRDEGKGSVVGERLRWWWSGLVERLLDLPWVWADACSRAREYLRQRRWTLADYLFELRSELRERLQRLATGGRPMVVLAAAGDGAGGADETSPPGHGHAEARQNELARREAALAERERQLELQSSRLEALEATLTQRLRRLREREEALDDPVAQREQPATEREGRERAAAAALPRAVRLASETAQRETTWWQKQLGSAPAAGPTAVSRTRQRFDPTVASALRRSRQERRRSRPV